VFAKLHSRRSPRSGDVRTCQRSNVSTCLDLNSHGIISFTDPHSLNSVVSYRYKNIGGQGPSSSSYFPSASVSVNSAPWVAFVLNPIPLFLPPSRDEKPVTATPSKSTVTNCDARNSFGIRFYENCRVSTPTIPILELTPSAHQPHSHLFFSCTYVEPILQPLCFDIHPCNGGVPPPQPANLQTFQRVPEPFLPSHQSPVTNHAFVRTVTCPEGVHRTYYWKRRAFPPNFSQARVPLFPIA